MPNIAENIANLKRELTNYNYNLVAISKTKPNEMILEAYETGHRDFGENKVQELATKHESLPKDIKWHMVGHLQRNKVKYIAPFVHLIHSVDSVKLLKAIDKEGKKCDRSIRCLLQVHIAEESTKFGFDEKELEDFLKTGELENLKNVVVEGMMGMATFTEDKIQIKREFEYLKGLFDKFSSAFNYDNFQLRELSMGMSGDYKIALECGSTMIRVGSSIFGERNYG